MPDQPPQFPAGPAPADFPERFSLDDLAPEIEALAAAPAALRRAVRGLSSAQLDTRYRNWTIRQIAHHLPDSHVNCYIRFMWTLTEPTPTIKAYDESAWSALPISRTGDVEPALALFEAIHGKWVALLRAMAPDDFARRFHHPESDSLVRLADAVRHYAWHARHHTAQILWRRQAQGWG